MTFVNINLSMYRRHIKKTGRDWILDGESTFLLLYIANCSHFVVALNHIDRSIILFIYPTVETGRYRFLSGSFICSGNCYPSLARPDSSKVWLNAGSSLRYPSRFTEKERNVQLSGEGYFEVQSDKEYPFYALWTMV